MVEVLGQRLPKPCATRWNSSYDCLTVFMSQDPKKIDSLCSKLSLPLLSSVDRSTVKEYLSIMKQVAIALDSLQGEKNCHLGSVLPLITKLKRRLKTLSIGTFGLLRDRLVERIEARYDYINISLIDR